MLQWPHKDLLWKEGIKKEVFSYYKLLPKVGVESGFLKHFSHEGCEEAGGSPFSARGSK